MGAYSLEHFEDGILLFTITREKKRNAINFEVMEGLMLAIDKAKSDNVKMLAITGEGEKAFCSGGDLSVFHEFKTAEEAYTALSKMGNILYNLMMLEKPTVAVINGLSLGGGCEIAAACDFRLGKKGIEAGFIQGNLAITTGWGGGTILSEKLPQPIALQMLTEAKRYNTEQLLQLSFLHTVYEDDPVTSIRQYFKQVLAKNVHVLQSYKEIWIEKWQKAELKERMDKEIQRCSILWAKDDHLQAVDNFMSLQNKR